MTTDPERLQVAQWILERNLHWISAAEVKTGVVLAIATGMLGALAAAFGSLPPTEVSDWTRVFAIISAMTLVASIFCVWMSIRPRTAGPVSSVIFCSRIASVRADEYTRTFRQVTADQLLEDCLAQVHRNAEIAMDKCKWVQASMNWLIVSVLPWVAAIALMVRA